MAVSARSIDGWSAARPSGLYARYRGATYSVVSYLGGRGRGFAVLQISESEVDRFDEITNPRRLRVSVPLGDLDGLIKVTTRGRIAGHEVTIMSIEPDRVCFTARSAGGELQLDGSWHDGFRGCRPRQEVELLGEEVRDLLARELSRPSRMM